MVDCFDNIESDNAMGVKVSRTSDVAVVEGDSELYSQNYCKMTFIDKGSNLIIGDILETSGSGGIYPAGLSVGVIREINSDAMGNLNYATVEPLVDFNKLYESACYKRNILIGRKSRNFKIFLWIFVIFLVQTVVLSPIHIFGAVPSAVLAFVMCGNS